MSGGDEMRFSDSELVVLQRKLDNHIIEYREYRELEADRWDNMMTIQEQNSKSIHTKPF